MEKSSRQLFLHWIEEKAHPQMIKTMADVHAIQHQLCFYCKELLNEVRCKTEAHSSKAELQFYLSKNFQLLVYCSKRLDDYLQLAMNKYQEGYEDLKIIIQATIDQFTAENSSLFLIEDEYFSVSMNCNILKHYYALVHQTAICLKERGFIQIANTLYRHIIHIISGGDVKGYIIYNTIELIEAIENLMYEKEFVELILGLNLNTYPFIKYMENYIQRNSNDTFKTDAHIKKIRKLIKEISCIQPETDYESYSTVSLKTYTLSLLKQELEYQQFIADSTREIVAGHKDVMEKIAMDLSVEELAAIIRLFKEQNIIKEQNVSKICRHIISCFKSSKTDNIALSSFMNKYYNVERRTIESLRNLFKEMHGKAQHL